MVAVVLVCGGGAAGGILASGSSSSYVATRPIGSALVKSPLVGAAETHGRALVQLGVPTILHFVPGATFAIAVIVTNKAAAPISLERAQVTVPRHSPLHQIGTRLVAFKPFVCPPGALCPANDPIGPGPYGVAARPIPLSVAPGQLALAQVALPARHLLEQGSARVGNAPKNHRRISQPKGHRDPSAPTARGLHPATYGRSSATNLS